MNPTLRRPKEMILKALSEGRWVSGEELGRTLGISRPAVWKYISRLKEEGYLVETLPGRGYRLTALPDLLYPELILSRLNTRRFGRTIHHFYKIDSTNTQARWLAAQGAEEGTLLVAEYQEKGRGRMDRPWQSPPGKNLLFSLILRPAWPPTEAFYGTVLSSVSLCRVIRETTGVEAGIKWPNDIYVGDKKLAGILTEMAADPDRIEYMIVGVGVNCQWAPPQPPPGGQEATSLLKETGREVSRLTLLVRFLEEAERLYAQVEGQGVGILRSEWDRFSLINGRRVVLISGEARRMGTCLGIDEQGALILEREDGTLEKYHTGDVHLRF
jgi:BirA family biotin operon repressor/biotin-[acetyl-CoA-carboxylase] ligase